MHLGLNDSDMTYIIDTIKKMSEIERAVIFGSRAKGNYKAGSDIDLAIFGEKVTFDTVSALHAVLEGESPLPYFFDVIDATHLEHQTLREHIDGIGKVIFEREI